MSKLIVFIPDGTTLDVPLARERTTIGRRADNDICLPDLAVSGEHAVVVTILADSFLEDLGSTNGTLVNGQAVAKHFLRDRDQVVIGRHKIVYCADDDAVMTSEIVGLARINARDFGERVETARPFARPRSPDVGEARESAQGTASTPAVALTTPAVPPIPDPAGAPAEVVAQAAPKPPTPPPMNLATSLPDETPASIKVLSGAKAGVSIPLSKPETTIGRPGIQVASIVNTGAAFRLKPVEGARPPTVNGKAAERDGVDLAPGDVIDIAGTQVEFVVTTRSGGDAAP